MQKQAVQQGTRDREHRSCQLEFCLLFNKINYLNWFAKRTASNVKRSTGSYFCPKGKLCLSERTRTKHSLWYQTAALNDGWQRAADRQKRQKKGRGTEPGSPPLPPLPNEVLLEQSEECLWQLVSLRESRYRCLNQNLGRYQPTLLRRQIDIHNG